MNKRSATLRAARNYARAVAVRRISWMLLGLLAIGAAIITLGIPNVGAEPSAGNFGPGGAAAFARLLKDSGYEVSDSYSTQPDLKDCDLAIAFRVARDETPILGQSNQVEVDTAQYLRTYAREGGAVLWLPLPDDFQDQSKQVSTVTFTNLPGPLPRGSVTFRPVQDTGTSDLLGTTAYELGETSNSMPVAVLSKAGEGHMVDVSDGIIATNRFIDRSDNAAVLLRLVGMLCRPGGKVAFVEGSWGNASPPSLMEAIGPWAIAGWWQLTFLGVVIVFTLGRPFGVELQTQTTQQGSREFVDAIANLYQRCHADVRAVEVSVARAERILRRRLKIPPEASDDRLRGMLPPMLVDALYGIRAASAKPTALAAVKRIDRELGAFLKTL